MINLSQANSMLWNRTLQARQETNAEEVEHLECDDTQSLENKMEEKHIDKGFQEFVKSAVEEEEG